MRVSSVLILTVVILSTSVAMAQRLAVSVPIANIRSGPSTDYGIIWNAEKYYPLSVIEKKDGWYRFKDFEGDEGWISGDIVDKTPTVITKASEVNVRTGPGTNHEIAFKVEKAVPFRVIEEKSQWVHIRHADGDSGWIYKPLVW